MKHIFIASLRYLTDSQSSWNFRIFDGYLNHFGLHPFCKKQKTELRTENEFFKRNKTKYMMEPAKLMKRVLKIILK